MSKQKTGSTNGAGRREEAYRDREQRWRQHLGAWRREGGSQAAYCRKAGLEPADFSWWKHELSRRDGKARRAVKKRPVKEAFVPVQIVAREGVEMICEVLLRNGQRLRVGAACEPAWIGEVARVLEEVKPC